MTTKEEREYKKELLSLIISKYIGGDISKLNNKNKKLYKDIQRKDVNTSIYTLNYINQQYYTWEVEHKDYELNSNFDRLIYLFNHNYEVCDNMLNQDETIYVESDEYKINIKSNNDIQSYIDLAEEVGL